MPVRSRRAERRLAGAHARRERGDHTRAVVGLDADVLAVEAELDVVAAVLPRRVVGEIVGIGGAALRLKLVDRIGEQRAVAPDGVGGAMMLGTLPCAFRKYP